MKHDEIKERIPLLIAGELPESDRLEIAAHVESCPECQLELAEFKEMEGLLETLRLPEPPDDLWEGYWSGIYNRIERGLGWILVSLGAVVILFSGFYWLVREMLSDPRLPATIKWAVLCIGGGLAVLLVSVIREQFFYSRHERYREVRR